MPMYVVRAKAKRAEQERLAQYIERQKSKGDRINRIINCVDAGYNLYSPAKVYIDENGESILPSKKIKKKNKGSEIYSDGSFSATGKQKIRGKSKPPRF
ncbi:hypothetical protein QMI71_004430 [Salmonella enterica]|nr:hypothetical protein [Salmonella enterica]